MKHNAEHYAQLSAKFHLSKIEDSIERAASRGCISFSYSFETHCDSITMNAIISDLREHGFNVELKQRVDEGRSMQYLSFMQK